ncbi:MAG: hypothetical protein VB013_07235 [Anaerolineaceae bacterium]|nr:hypothetical protein [Anaerolineaceae bacterium]
MPAGTPVNRQWVVKLKDGTIVIDWGDALFQDVHSGDFISANEKEVSHHLENDELDLLIRIGKVTAYNAHTVWFNRLPERPQSTME